MDPRSAFTAVSLRQFENQKSNALLTARSPRAEHVSELLGDTRKSRDVQDASLAESVKDPPEKT